MKKSIGSILVWQFTLLVVAILTTFTVVVNAYNKRQNKTN